MDEMTPEEFRQKLGTLLEAEYFAPIAVTRDGEPRIVVVPIAAYHSIRRGSPAVIRTEDLTEEQIKALTEAEVPEGRTDLPKGD